MKYFLISQNEIDDAASCLFDNYDQYGIHVVEKLPDYLRLSSPIQWLPIDPNNPIPKPTNERQVLQLYKPAYDNEQSLRKGQSPIFTLKSVLVFVHNSTRPLSDLFYWNNYDWRSKETKDQTNEVGWLSIGYTQYCIFESPKPAQP